MRDYRSKNGKKTRAYQDRHRAAGLCLYCPRRVDPGFVRCAPCRAVQRAGAKKRAKLAEKTWIAEVR